MCTGRLLLIYEEHMPPGAASGGERGARRAVASATLQRSMACRARRAAAAFASRCRCGARQAARGGAFRSRAPRCA